MKYTNLAELMLYNNELAEDGGAPPEWMPHHADEIAGAWKTWVLDEPVILGYHIFASGSNPLRLRWQIPAGFMTDFASIPRVFRWLFDPNGAPWQRAAVLHDFLYSTATVSRAYADRQYYWQSRQDGTSELAAALQYVALRIGGWAAFRSNRRKQAEHGRGWRIMPPSEPLPELEIDDPEEWA